MKLFNMKLFNTLVCATTLIYVAASPVPDDPDVDFRAAKCTFSPNCDSTGEAKIPIPCKGFCHKYFLCENGKFSLKSCGWLQNFNNRARQCDYKFKDCDWWMDKPTTQNPDNPTTSNNTDEPPEGTTQGTTVPTNPPTTEGPCVVKAECDQTGTERKPIPCPNFCDKYYFCKEGNFTVETCSGDTRFNPFTRKCSYYFNNCEWYKNETTISPPTTTHTTSIPATTKASTVATTVATANTTNKTSQANTVFKPTISLFLTVLLPLLSYCL